MVGRILPNRSGERGQKAAPTIPEPPAAEPPRVIKRLQSDLRSREVLGDGGLEAGAAGVAKDSPLDQEAVRIAAGGGDGEEGGAQRHHAQKFGRHRYGKFYASPYLDETLRENVR